MLSIWVVPFGQLFCLRYRFPEIPDEVPKKVSEGLSFNPPWSESPSLELRRVKMAWQAANDADPAKFATVSGEGGLATKNDAASEVGGHRVSNLMVNTVT